MRLAIADPPYLGRAALWYGGKQHPHYGTPGRAKGRSRLSAEFHHDASAWDDPDQHMALMTDLDLQWDGWAMAASAKTIAEILPHAASLGGRLAVWHVTNAIPDGARVRSVWEALIYKVPESRRAAGTGMSVPDVLSAPHPVSGFVGAKPDRWTTWVLDLLGFDPAQDTVSDLFPGSGAVSRVVAGRLI